LALADARAFFRKVDEIGTEPLSGERKARACTRAVFPERIDDHPPAQRRNLFDAARRDLFEAVGGIQREADLIGGQLFERQQMLASPELLFGGHRGSTRISSRPSISLSRTLTRWFAGTSRSVSPTKSAWIGSSRPPRSTSSARRIALGRP